MNLDRRKAILDAYAKACNIRREAKISPVAPIDPVELARVASCKIIYAGLDSLEGLYQPEPEPTIILGSNRPLGRRAFNCAHELGHHLFCHGIQFSELVEQKTDFRKPIEEVIADAFAANLLMPKQGVLKAIKDRGLTAEALDPEDIFKISSYFGVGYSTLITHLEQTIKCIDFVQKEKLLDTKPAFVKSKYDLSSQSELIFVDRFWKHRSVDLEIGDSIHVPIDVEPEDYSFFNLIRREKYYSILQGEKTGITRLVSSSSEWAANVRISRKNYTGHAEYRYLEE